MSQGPELFALDDLRVIDLTDECGVYAAKLFADLGADVIRVESPKGDPLRTQHPLFDPGPESGAVGPVSLPYLHFNSNKRAIALDLETSEGRVVLERLIGDADVVLESYHPTEAERIGLSADRLASVNRQLVHTSITGFGLSGPHRDYISSDLVAQAMSGLMVLTGFPDDPPARLPAAQAYHQVSLEAAVGTMAVILQRDLGGGGGHVELSMQDALAVSTAQTANLNHWTQLKVVPLRAGTGNPARTFEVDDDGAVTAGGHGAAPRRTIFECSDGWAVITPRLVDWEPSVAWLSELGVASALTAPKFDDPAARQLADFYPVIERLVANVPVERVYHGGQAHGLLNAPVRTMAGLFEDEQLRARGFFVELEHPELGTTLTYAGAPYQLSETPWQLRRPAPRAGEHTEEVLRDLSYSDTEIARLAEQGVVRLEHALVGRTAELRHAERDPS